ncbi:MAG: hypothetical protein LUH18_02385 [Oscillospiraceae bacterium]|nr:hypothetical protein [Oscillospiraceae bacterium]
MKKRIFVILLSLCLAIAAMTVMAMADTWYLEDGDITISANDSGQTVTQGTVSISDANPVISNSTPATSTAYTITVLTSGNASANFTLSNVNISTSGKASIDVGVYSANITLSGSNTLYGSDNPAIHVSSGSLTISGGTNDALSAVIDSNGAAIGSNSGEDFSGSIVITGGNIISSAGTGAGIGSGYKGKFSGTISIAGGTVAGSAVIGAGIGSGANKEGGFSGTINISGGTVTGSTTGTGAGIGGGEAGDFSGSITISGGTVTAINSYNRNSGAGIGAGAYATFSGSINITGGTIKATSANSEGIGVGKQGTVSSTAVYNLVCDVVSNNEVIGTLTDLSTVVSGSTSTNTTVSHSYDNGTVTQEATCTDEGVMTYTCLACGSTYTGVIAKISHTAGEAVVEDEVLATCTEDGSYDKVVYCTDCGEELSRETITVPATGHSYTVEWSWNGSSATAILTCSGCNDVQRIEAEVTSKNILGVVTYTATVTFNGETYTSTQTSGTSLLTIGANYTAVNEAIAKANALNPSDYTNFADVTAAISAVDWTLNVLNQPTVNAYAEAIEAAIENLVPVDSEDVEITEPIEDTNTESEPDSEPEESEPETNPTTGIAVALLPMVVAVAGVVAGKRR